MDDKERDLPDELIGEEESTLLDMLLDESNNDNIWLQSAAGEKLEFVQVAVIPLDGKLYAILQPVVLLEGMAEDEALVFSIEGEAGEEQLIIVLDEAIIDRVFEIYDAMYDEATK